MAFDQPEYATPVAVAMPEGDKGHRAIKQIAFLDSDGNPIDITAGTAPAAGTITPNALKGFNANTDKGALVKINPAGDGFTLDMPSSIGNVLINAANTATARNAVGLSTTQVATEAKAAVKAKVTSVQTLATDAALNVAVQKINELIASLQA